MASMKIANQMGVPIDEKNITIRPVGLDLNVDMSYTTTVGARARHLQPGMDLYAQHLDANAGGSPALARDCAHRVAGRCGDAR